MKQSYFPFCLKFCIALWFTLISSFAAVQAQSWEWGRQGGSADFDYGTSIATDASGNLFVLGSFQGFCSFGATNIFSRGFDDILIAKYNSVGALLWLKTIGSSGFDSGNGIVVDPAGSVYITGSVSDSAYFDTQIVTTASASDDIFLAKYDGNGSLIWVRTAGGQFSDYASAIATDNTGNVFITGGFSDVATFATNVTVTAAGFDDAFAAAYNTVGALIWVRQAGGTEYDFGTAIKTDPAGNVYVSGVFDGTGVFGTFTITTSGFDDIFLLKYDNIGTLAWAKRAGGANYDSPNAMAVDNTGSIYLTGSFIGTAFFDSQPISSAGNDDMFVVKYNANGNIVWMQSGGGGDFDGGYGIAFDNNGKLYVCGGFSGTATFNANSVTSVSGLLEDIFIARYDLTGNIDWVKRAGGANSDLAYGMVCDAAGNAYVTGNFYNNINFGNPLVSNGSSDFFLAKFNPLLVGIADMGALGVSFRIYPNPIVAGGVLAIEHAVGEINQLQLVDALGRIVTQVKLNSGLTLSYMSLNETMPGIYFVRVISTDGSTVNSGKVVVR